MNWELNIINRIANGLLIGFSFYYPEPDTPEYNFYEFNIFLLIIQFQFRWE